MELKETIGFFKSRAKASIPFASHVMRQTDYLIRKGKIKNAMNYLWVLGFTEEDGASLTKPFYEVNPDWAPYPQRIEVEVTTNCCLRCLKCEQRYWNEKRKNMTYEQFIHIVKQFPNLREVSMTGIGHGFQNPDYMKMLRYLKSRQIFVQFFDPFLLLNEKILSELVDIGVDKTVMSIDGATKKTLEKLQVGSNFETVTRNIQRLVELKKEKKSMFPEVTFQFIVQKYNVKEMPKLIELVDEITKDDPSLFRTIQFIKLISFKENSFLIPHVTKKIYNETIQRAKELGRFRLTFCNIPDSRKKPPISKCTAWNVPFITVDGDVYPCCSLTEGNIRHLIKNRSFGTFHVNLFKQDFRDVWYSKEFRGFIRMLNKGQAPEICVNPRRCPIFEIKG
jgi:MoaA/NifB/PqqE/SkfB family radical SAM enzyme